jgi:hypothetical protein
MPRHRHPERDVVDAELLKAQPGLGELSPAAVGETPGAHLIQLFRQKRPNKGVANLGTARVSV